MVRRTVELKNLEAGKEYNVQIRAIGGNEEYASSNWSTRLNFTTDEDTLGPGEVLGVDLKAVARAFRVTWVELVTDGDGSTIEDLKDYKVVWEETSTPSNQFVQYTQVNNATLTYEQNVEELGGVPDITVRVYGRDYAHNLSATAGVDSVTNVAPGTFTGLLADRDSTESQAIAVEWPQPSGALADGSNNGDDLSYYEVYRDSVKIEDIAFSPGPTRYLDPDPRPGEHTYYVVAYDVFGNSIQSNSDTATPIYSGVSDSIPPDPPINLVLTPGVPENSRDGTEAFIDVAFDAPITNSDSTDYEDNEGFIIRWKVVGTNDIFERYVSDTRQDPPTDPRGVTARINELETSTNYEVSVAAYDTSRNASSPYLTGTTTTPKDQTAPDQPSAPTASNGVQSILVSHDLTTVLAETLPDDVVDLSVHASESSGFTADASNQIGIMPVVPGVPPVQKFTLPNEETSTDSATPKTWYVKVIAVDASGNSSIASPQATSAPDLISGASILNATINDAKINTLSANKLVAGSVFTDNLFIQNKMTVDNAGFIKSGDWDGTDLGNNSTQGWWIGDTGIVINDGTVQADAFTVIEGNLVPYQYSTFTNFKRWYKGNTWTTGDDAINEIGINAWKRYAFQSLEWSAGTAGDVLLLAPGQTIYNVPVDVSSRYIYSLYAYNPTGTAITLRLSVEDSGSVTTVGSDEVIPAGEYRRISLDYETTATATGVVLGLENRNGGALQVAIDGVQFEQVSAESNGSPSRFVIPGNTRITGNSITTGQIESSDYDGQGLGWKIDLLGNVEFNDGFFSGNIQATDGTLENMDISGVLDLVTSGLLRTSATGSRVELDGAGFRFYDDDGTTELLALDTATGSATFAGALSAATGTFSGSLDAASGTFTGSLQAASGSFSGSLSAASGTFTGTLSGADGDFTGSITATSGAISGTLSVTGKLRSASSGARIEIGANAYQHPSYSPGDAINIYDGNDSLSSPTGRIWAFSNEVNISTKSSFIVWDDDILSPMFEVDVPASLTSIQTNIDVYGYIRSWNGSLSSPTYSFQNDQNTGMFRSASNDLSFSAGGGTRAVTLDASSDPGFRPGSTNSTFLGHTNYRWHTTYSVNGVVTGSDARGKTDIKEENLGLKFLRDVGSKSWRRPEDPDRREHHGPVAQDVKKAIDKHGVDFAGYYDPAIEADRMDDECPYCPGGEKEDYPGAKQECKDWHKAQQQARESGLGLVPSEFIGPIIRALGELDDRLEELERKQSNANI